MTNKIQGTPHGDCGWRIDRVQYFNTDVYELCCEQDGNVIAAFHTVEEMSGFARMLHEDIDLRGDELEEETKAQYMHIISAIGDAVRGENTRRHLEMMAMAEARNDERVKRWEEGRRERAGSALG